MQKCNFCLGKKKGGCTTCSGSGYHSCSECEDGYVYRYKQIRYQDECHICRGEGRDCLNPICRSCGGRGWKFYTDNELIEGSGEKCTFCNGENKMCCNLCNGTGDITHCSCEPNSLGKNKFEFNTFNTVICLAIFWIFCVVFSIWSDSSKKGNSKSFRSNSNKIVR